jgi:pyridoxine 5'-phosphate synthase PdxJ
LNDKVSYSGGYSQSTEWSYEDNTESASNPNTLGEALKQTFARVDKANKQIDIVASEAAANKAAIATIQLNTDEINLSMQKMEQVNKETADSINNEIAELTERVNLSITEEQLTIAVKSELDNGVAKVTTNTGFTFDDTGLTVSKQDSEMSTTITDDGMRVYRDGAEMLEANNQGVNAVNLHATTYLIIGNNSRLEDYGSNRTGCFWIGGNN